MAIQFPDAPFQGQSFVASNGVSYTYDNGGWIANSQSALDDRYVNLDGDSMTGDLTVPSLNGGPLAGFRNQLINGQGLIGQRSLNNVAAADGDYPSLDRWHTASGIQLLKVYNPESVCPGFPTGARAVTTTNRWVRQLIELPSTYDGAVTYAPGVFYGTNQFTLSIWSDRAVEVAYSFADNNKLDNFTSVASNHAMTATGITRTSINGVVYQLYTDTFNINNVIPAATNAAFSVQFSFEANQTTNWTGAQLEPGPVATPFEHRPIQTELALCQRYFYSMENAVATTYSNGSGAYDRANLNCEFPVMMRALPTITFTGNGYWVPASSGGATPAGDVNGGITGTAISLVLGYKSLTRCQFDRTLSSGSTLTRGVTYNCHSGTDSSNVPAWADAEL